MIGTVKFYDASKQWGFIIYDNGEIFVHGNEIESPHDTLLKDQLVEFELKPAKKGSQAAKVRLI